MGWQARKATARARKAYSKDKRGCGCVTGKKVTFTVTRCRNKKGQFKGRRTCSR